MVLSTGPLVLRLFIITFSRLLHYHANLDKLTISEKLKKCIQSLLQCVFNDYAIVADFAVSIFTLYKGVILLSDYFLGDWKLIEIGVRKISLHKILNFHFWVYSCIVLKNRPGYLHSLDSISSPILILGYKDRHVLQWVQCGTVKKKSCWCLNFTQEVSETLPHACSKSSSNPVQVDRKLSLI